MPFKWKPIHRTRTCCSAVWCCVFKIRHYSKNAPKSVLTLDKHHPHPATQICSVQVCHHHTNFQSAIVFSHTFHTFVLHSTSKCSNFFTLVKLAVVTIIVCITIVKTMPISIKQISFYTNNNLSYLFVFLCESFFTCCFDLCHFFLCFIISHVSFLFGRFYLNQIEKKNEHKMSSIFRKKFNSQRWFKFDRRQ